MKLAFKTVVVAGLIAGTLDLALAIGYFAVSVHAPFAAVPLAVASGLLGARAYSLGNAGVVLGIGLHYFIALTVAAVYFAASRGLGILTRRPIVSGAAYGIGVFLVMQYVVLPLSARPGPRHMSAGWMVADIGSHVFFIGITIAVITRRYAAW